MAFDLNQFKNFALENGGYRPSLFEIRVSRLGLDFSFLCQAAAVPALTMGVIEVPYFGRKIKVAGDRTYAEWTTTLMIEEDFSTRQAIENWNLEMNRPILNQRDVAAAGENYKETANVILYNKIGVPVRTYTLEGCWPSEVGTVELDWNTTDTIGTYTVTWAFDYMGEADEGSVIGRGINLAAQVGAL